MADPNYFDEADLAARLSARVVQQILDDNNDGSADALPIARLIADSKTLLDRKLGPVFGAPFQLPIPEAVKALALDAAAALCAQRHPEAYGQEWEPLRKQFEKDIDAVRMGKDNLGNAVGVDPGANRGGFVRSGIPGETTPKPKFSDDFGYF